MSGEFDLSASQLSKGAEAFGNICRSEDVEAAVASLSATALYYLAGHLMNTIGHGKGVPGVVKTVVELECSRRFLAYQANRCPNDTTAAEAYDEARAGTASEMRGKDGDA